MLKYAVSIAVLLISGCANYQPVPEGYTGPVAIVKDTGFQEDGTTAQLFVLDKVDGKKIDTSFEATVQASHGQGFALTTVFEVRDIPARPMKVELYGSHTTAAPIQAMYKQLNGTFYSVQGEVEFSPQADRRYVVKGKLAKAQSSIWIEDSETGEKVTTVVTK
ncbi:hypothetical protein A9Q79_00420 [Methylophaga sp. 42_25_T18]|nr:hypothetical protein A9Q79_00420 [Methylophaga sp. 42_25_T18]